MAKNLCDHVKLNKFQDPQIKDELGILSVDEIFELAIYDATSIQARKELTRKKVRTVFANTPITVRVMFKNTLSSTFLDLKNITIKCKHSLQSEDSNLYN